MSVLVISTFGWVYFLQNAQIAKNCMAMCYIFEVKRHKFAVFIYFQTVLLELGAHPMDL